MNDTIMTIRGWVGGAPRHYPKDPKVTGSRMATTFRVGVTPRYYSRAEGEYQDGMTTWFSVRSYGNLAYNAASSLGKGTPVIVRGKLSTRQWSDKDGVVHNELVIVADSIGVEISAGMANYVRVMRIANPDETDQWRTSPDGQGLATQAERSGDDADDGTPVGVSEADADVARGFGEAGADGVEDGAEADAPGGFGEERADGVEIEADLERDVNEAVA